MTSKVLKLLTRADLLVSHRGAQGGYGLARPAASISVAEVVEALDGPIAITTCTEPTPGDCSILSLCPARANWERINHAIRESLSEVTPGRDGPHHPGGLPPAGRACGGGAAVMRAGCRKVTE